MSLFNFAKRFASSRVARIGDLEAQVLELEGLRDDQRDLMEATKRAHVEDMRKAQYAADDKIAASKRELEGLRAIRAREDEELQHLIKMKESKLQMEFDRKTIELEREQARAIEAVKKEYQSKVEAHLNERITDLGKMYGELLERLPNIGVALKGRV